MSQQVYSGLSKYFNYPGFNYYESNETIILEPGVGREIRFEGLRIVQDTENFIISPSFSDYILINKAGMYNIIFIFDANSEIDQTIDFRGGIVFNASKTIGSFGRTMLGDPTKAQHRIITVNTCIYLNPGNIIDFRVISNFSSTTFTSSNSRIFFNKIF